MDKRNDALPSPPVLFFNVLIIATCGLIYELLAGTVASYLLGDSITQFSFVIGIYLAALGVGAWLSGFIGGNLARRFVEVELAVALVGGCSAPILFLSFAYLQFFHVILYSMVVAIGILVGLEIPLLMRMLQGQLEFKDLVSRVLTFDYIGSLLAAVLFPLLFVPRMGLVRTSLIFGLLNAGVGLWGTYQLAPLIQKGITGLRVRAAIVTVLLGIGLLYANRLTSMAEDNMYADEIIFTRTSPYQRIVVTRGRAGFNLFLNGHLQFSAADEYRYHEALVHPAMLLQEAPGRVLVLGGGDGLALREILKYSSVKQVTLVDLDPEMTGLSAHFPPLADLNARSFSDPRVQVVNQDAMIWLEKNPALFDVAIVDFPDPNSFSLGKLYTSRFYRLLKQHLTPEGSVAVQCTSPLFARPSYWCIIRTMEAAGFAVRPYHAAVPSFGEWGFALARPRAPGSVVPASQTPTTQAAPSEGESAFALPSNIPFRLRFLDLQTLNSLFVLGADMGPVKVEINRLDNQVLVRYYESDWRRWE